MKVGILGLPQAGKKTLFQILTGNQVKELGASAKPVPGTADIIDPRFNQLVEMYTPKKQTPARIDLVLLPKLEQETITNGAVFQDISDVDAICQVVRSFTDETVYHPAGSVDAIRDLATVNAELLMHDQIFVEKRIERLEAQIKKIKDEKQLKELELMKKMQVELEHERPLRLLELTEDEKLLIRSYPFITGKEMIVAFNTDEAQLGSPELLAKAKPYCDAHKITAMLVSAQVESEIALLDTVAERNEFLEDLGIDEPALGKLTRHCLEALGRISFFTVGPEEVHQWLVRAGSSAPVAAGTIHSDLQKGFIRAEVMKYAELCAAGSEAELKKQGKMYVQGKEYTVVDGDILNIRFAV